MPATADPDLALQLAKSLVDLYASASDKLLHQVARRIARGIDQPGWAEAKLVDVTNLRNAAQRELEALRSATPEKVAEALEKARQAGIREAAEVTVDRPVATNTRAVRLLVEETVTNLQRTHTQMLRSTMDVYRQTVTEAGTADVVAGVRTRREAAQQVLDRFANKGVTGFVDRRGRAWALESYTEMAVRTSAGRAQVNGTLERFQQDGRDLVIVSDAPQECDACRPWEGRILSISGQTPVGTKLSGGFVVAGTVSEATGSGLLHANCRHSMGAYVDGLTEPPRHTEDPEGDRLRQEQRRLERGVRQWKRRETVGLDDATRAKARRKKREWQGRLKTHVDRNNLKRQRAREQLDRAI